MNVEKLLPEAINFMRDGEIEKAQSFLNQILKEFPKNPDALTQSGIILIHERKFKKGINLIESSLLIKPNQPEALLHLGIAFYQENKFDQAIKYFDDAIKLQPDYSEAIYTKALSYEKMNLIEDAINNYNLALNKNPNYLNPIINLAYLYFKLENFEIAKNFFIKAQNLNPENNEFSQKISEINNHLGNYEESLEYWNKRILSDPTDADACNNKAVTLMNLDRLDEAKFLFLEGLKINPEDTTVMINLAGLYEEQRDFTDAESVCKKILDLVPHHDKSINMLGKIAIDLGKNDSAHSYINQALNLRPDNIYALLNKAKLLERQKQTNLAAIEYKKLRSSNDQIALTNMSLFYLHHKEFLTGWELYKSRQNIGSANETHKFEEEISKIIPLWEGQYNCESLLIIGEQGIGDQIIYLSMLYELSQKIKKITVLIDIKIIQLFERSFKDIKFISYKPKKYIFSEDFSSFKYYICMGDLGGFLRNSVDKFKKQPNFYINADIGRTEKFRIKSVTNKLVCGIAWKSLTRHEEKYNKASFLKSACLTDLLPILKLDNLIFQKIQYGDVKNEIKHLKENFNIDMFESDNDNYNDLDGLASLIQSCDFIITTSNVTAHIAGALGKKTFLLVPFPYMLWYWHDEDQSLWYPSISIFTQEVPENWTSPINKMLFQVLDYLKNFSKI